MTKKTNTTPLQAARAWAAEHPEFEGKIEVNVLRPKGKGGWGVMHQAVTVWARDGKATLSKRQRLDPWDRLSEAHNGHCVACGRVYLEPVLATVYRKDERAGQPLGPENADERDRFLRAHEYLDKSKRPRPIYAWYCSLYNVCVTCAAALGMELEPRVPQMGYAGLARHRAADGAWSYRLEWPRDGRSRRAFRRIDADQELILDVLQVEDGRDDE